MAETTDPFVWPETVVPTRASFYPATQTALYPRPFATQAQRLSRPGGKFMSELQFDNLPKEKAAALDGLIAGMKGPYGSVLIPVWRRCQPAGPAVTISADEPLFETGEFFPDGTGFVTLGRLAGPARLAADAKQGASEIVVDRFAPSQQALSAGDFVGLGTGRVYMVAGTAPVVTDASGVATIPIWPPLRSNQSEGAEVVLDCPKARMRLIDDNQASSMTRKPNFSAYRLRFEEDVTL